MQPFKSFVICTSPRSGSTLLCKLLSATGVAGHPGSHFHRPDMVDWLEEYELDNHQFATKQESLAAIVTAALQLGEGGTDVFGLRLQRQSAAYFFDHLALLAPDAKTDKDRMEAVFGTTLFIHLTRENKLDQAVSYVKATQSGLWHKAPDGTEIERLSEPRPLIYDQKAIAEAVALFEAAEEKWLDWFVREDIDPVLVRYDDLDCKPFESVARILKALGQDPRRAADIALPVARLADDVNAEWARRFAEDIGLQSGKGAAG